jgi:transposase
MLSVTSATRVLVASTPVDLRGSFNRLYSLVVEQLKAGPLSGHLFVFTNRRRNRIKVFYWDGGFITPVLNQTCTLQACLPKRHPSRRSERSQGGDAGQRGVRP